MTVLMLEELSVDLDDTAPKASLIETLMADLAREHETDPPRLIETHISWVILQGEDAWKIKKPVDLGFLDFSSLERRHQACLDELRLNRRLAPDIYLDVVPITRTWGRPRLDGEGEVLDYAVHMRRFDPDQGLDRLLTAGRLDDDLFDTLARRIAAFHEAAAAAGPDQVRGGPQQFIDPALANFPPLATALGDDNELRLRLKHLEHWTRRQAEQLQSMFRQRLADGHVRECHGDLHLGNIVLDHDRPLIFDCIEFNPGLRWIDTLSDLAFLLMDLDHHQRPDLAWRVLNTYLEVTGDYAGLALLDFYRAYRALVRAKVNVVRLGQAGIDESGANEARRQSRGYIGQAQTYTTPRQPALLITCGVSGSGKTHYSRQLSRQLGAIHLRSDIERKRLFGLKPLQPSDGIGIGIYTAEASDRTFRRLWRLAGQLLDAGHSVIVDATFIERARRDDFRQLAREHGTPFLILLFDPETEVLKARIRSRMASGGDASEADIAVMEAQLLRFERPGEEEVCHHIGDDGDDVATIKRKFSLIPP